MRPVTRIGADTVQPNAVLISTDAAFREQFRGLSTDGSSPMTLAAVISRPFTEISDVELGQLRSAAPALAIVDLGSEPEVGVRFVQFLMDAGIAPAVMAAGRDLSSNLVVRAVQAGAMEIVGKPVTHVELREALDRVWRKTGLRSASQETNQPARVTALIAAKGGAGTTSLATNLAIEIHRLTRSRLLLLDLDVELGETALLLGVDPRFSLADLVRNVHRADPALLASYIARHDTGIDLLAAKFQPADPDILSPDRLRQVLRFLKQQFQHVVMDTPKSVQPSSLTVLEEADEILLVTTPTLSAIRNVRRLLPLLKLALPDKTGPVIRLVVNRHSAGEMIPLQDISDALGCEIFHTLRNDFVAMNRATNEARPLVVGNPGSAYARDVRALAEKLTGVNTMEGQGRRGLKRWIDAWTAAR
jgi:pilus assembly protein CpaE